MPSSKVDKTAPEVYSKNKSQYDKGITAEGTRPGDAEKNKRPKEYSNTGGERD